MRCPLLSGTSDLARSPAARCDQRKNEVKHHGSSFLTYRSA
jgi:hypothetical protein